MDIEDTEKTGRAKKRLTLTDSRAVRSSLCKLARKYLNGEISDVKIRNLTYVLNSILQADRLINVETDLTKKFEQLEQLVRGEGGTMVDPKELENPYAQNLKKQLVNEQKVNAQLNEEILKIKRQLVEIRAVPSDMESVDVA